jgi:hypothetical protein
LPKIESLGLVLSPDGIEAMRAFLSVQSLQPPSCLCVRDRLAGASPSRAVSRSHPTRGITAEKLTSLTVTSRMIDLVGVLRFQPVV